MLDIKITNAKTRKTGKELVEIGIENGKITAIASSVQGIYIGNGRSGRFKGIQ